MYGLLKWDFQVALREKDDADKEHTVDNVATIQFILQRLAIFLHGRKALVLIDMSLGSISVGESHNVSEDCGLQGG